MPGYSERENSCAEAVSFNSKASFPVGTQVALSVRSITLLVFIAAILSPNLALLLFHPGPASFAKFAIGLIVLLIWLAAFRGSAYAIGLTLPVFLLLPFDLFYAVTFHEAWTAPVLSVILNTNPEEASDYLQGRWLLAGGAVLLSLTIWACAFAQAFSREWRQENLRLLNFARIALAALCVAMLLALHPRFSGVDTNVNAGTELGRAGRIITQTELPLHLSKLRSIFPIGRLISVVELYVGERNNRVLRDRLQASSFGALSSPLRGRETYVLVIGEASRPDRWQLGGYGRETNPLLSGEPNLVWLSNMVTPWTYTLVSVPVMTTPKPASDSAYFLSYKSILSLFKEAGFRTYWVSNQLPKPRDSAPVGQVAAEADERYWVNASRDDVDDSPESSPDEALLPPLDEILKRDEQRQFIVLQLMGSHDAYHRRYPAAFNRFRPSLTDMPDANYHSVSNRELISNAYDNSVLYTDSVLNRVITSLQGHDRVSALLYEADHGESLFDGQCSFIGHGGPARINYPVSAFVWLSPRYMREFPDMMPVIRANANKRLSTENTFESMADLARISYPGADRSKSIFSSSLRERPRLVHVGQSLVDWDQAHFVGECEIPTAPQ